MGVKSKLFYTAVLAGLTLLHFSAYASSASSTNLDDKNCTDCCNYLACSGLDNLFDNPNFTTDMFFDHLCSKINIAVMPSCLSKSNLQDCSFLRKLLTVKISQDQISKDFEQMCNQRGVVDEMKNISKCIEDSGEDIDEFSRCQTPYINGMQDPNSDLCDVLKTMSSCVVGVLKATKCDEKYATLYEKYKNQMTTNSFCTKPSNGSQREILHIGLFILAVLYFIF